MDESNEIQIQIASDLDYENLIAEITFRGRFVGLLSNEPGQGLCFEIPDGKGDFNAIGLDSFKVALERARKELLQE